MIASLSLSDFVGLNLLMTGRMLLMPYDVGVLTPFRLCSTHIPPWNLGGGTVWSSLGLAAHVCCSWTPLSDQLRFVKDYNGAGVMPCCCRTAPCLVGPPCVLADNLARVVGAMFSRTSATKLGTLAYSDTYDLARSVGPASMLSRYKLICRVLSLIYNFTIRSSAMTHYYWDMVPLIPPPSNSLPCT